MAARDNRFLLLTQDPRLVNACTAALQDQPVEVVPVREAGPLPALLGRRVDGVFVDLNLPDLTLQAAADELAQRRELPTIILSQESTDVWNRISRGSPLEKVVAVPIDADELISAVDGLLERSRFLLDEFDDDLGFPSSGCPQATRLA